MNAEGSRTHEISASINDSFDSGKGIHETDLYVNSAQSFRVVIDGVRFEFMSSETARITLYVYGSIVLSEPLEGLNKIFLELDYEHVGPVSVKPSDSKYQHLIQFGNEGEISDIPIEELFEFILYGKQPGWCNVSVTATVGKLKARSDVLVFLVPRGVPGPI